MGTNYYWQRPALKFADLPSEHPLRQWGRDWPTLSRTPDALNQLARILVPADEIHIGKSSAGWAFQLHVAKPGADDGEGYDGMLPDDLEDWVRLFVERGSTIRDSYGAEMSVVSMLDRILSRNPTCRHNETDARRSLRIEDFTYDHHYGEFS